MIHDDDGRVEAGREEVHEANPRIEALGRGAKSDGVLGADP